MALTANFFTGAETGGLEESSGTSGSGLSASTTQKRTGSYSYSGSNSANRLHFSPFSVVSDAGNGYVVGISLYYSTLLGTSNVFVIGEGGDAVTNPCLLLQVLSDGSVRVLNANSAIVATSATGVITAATWNTIAVYFNHSDTGAYSVIVNGSSVLSGTSDFSRGGTLDTLTLYGGALTVYYDDIFVLSGATSSADAHCGASVIRYWSTNNSVNGDGVGNALTSGTWLALATVPISTSVGASMDASAQYGQVYTNDGGGSSTGGPSGDSNITGTILGAKLVTSASRSGGGGTTHYHKIGKSSGGGAGEEFTISLTTSQATYINYAGSTYIPPTSEYGMHGARVAGNQDLDLYGQVYTILHAPPTSTLQTVIPSGIASAEAFGTAILKYTQFVSSAGAIATAEAFGTQIVKGKNTLVPTGIATAEAFGTAKLNLKVIPTGIASAEAIGSPSILYQQFIIPSGISSAEAVGSVILTAAYTVSAAGNIASAEAFGTPKLNMYIVPAGIVSGEAFGNPTVVYEQFIIGTGIPSAEAFGTATVVPAAVVLIPSGIASAEAFGSVTVVPGVAYVIPTSIASAEAFGNPTLTALATIIANAIASAEAFGVTTLTPSNRITGVGNIASAEAFGSTQVIIPTWYINPTAILTAEAFGTHIVTNLGGTQYINASGIASQEAFGTVTIVPGGVVISGVGGIPSAEAFGLPTRILEPYIISGTGIPSAEAFGTSKLNMFIHGAGNIASEEAVGTNINLEFASVICTGIPSEEAFGTPIVTGGQRVWDAGDITTDISRWVTKDILSKLKERLS